MLSAFYITEIKYITPVTFCGIHCTYSKL